MMLTIIEKWGSHVNLQMYTRLNISHGGLNNRRHFLFSFLFYFVNVKDENVKKKKWNVLNSLRSESLSALHNSIILTNIFFCSLMFVGKLHHLYFFSFFKPIVDLKILSFQRQQHNFLFIFLLTLVLHKMRKNFSHVCVYQNV